MVNYKLRVPWQNDPNLIIDRFDVRAHLDTIPEDRGSAEDGFGYIIFDIKHISWKHLNNSFQSSICRGNRRRK